VKVGIGLPSSLPEASPELLLEWARRADAGPFSSLSVLDRLVYRNYDSLIALSAAAAVTQRIGLVVAVLLAPLRNAGVLAKQAATLDVLSGGRFSLGLAVGIREEDFQVAPADYRRRGKQLDEQIALMKRVWAGETVASGEGVVGPPPATPGGPRLLIGGFAPAAIARVGQCDGYIGGGTEPDREVAFRMAEEAWRANGRSGRPWLVANARFGLGPEVQEATTANIYHYYRTLGPSAEFRSKVYLSSPEAVRQTISELSDIGVDEILLSPGVPELEQIDRLADLVG
jgi:alkanesulfonate monooxygenase SsuD/methylene tetrahydromethanopterin reductase-like flavin-dependent oxidoreductase (luciferase family)